MNFRIYLTVWILLAYQSVFSQLITSDSGFVSLTHTSIGIALVHEPPIGGRGDLMGDGAMLLAKSDSLGEFWKSSTFVSEGTWVSKWIPEPATRINLEWCVYGKEQDMGKGWTKFSGNPLITEYQWKHTTPQTLQLPKAYSAKPADQSLVKGTGAYEGKWLLLFNIGGWAVKGWGMAMADSLAPLKAGKNPFSLAEPYPLTKATGGFNAPNDWIYADSLWYAPDESRDHASKMWTSKDLLHWTLHGNIEGINGHDPGMVWDGSHFYLFNEANNDITLVKATDPLGEWSPMTDPQTPEKEGVAVAVGDHTGDADIAFFNNRWHMFMDDGVHLKYKLSYASTTPEEFPFGWKLQSEVFGPHHPEQGQTWDDDTAAGNDFGTGDADIVLEGKTLYMTYETPVGIAYKELDLLDASEQELAFRVEYQNQKRPSNWYSVPAGKADLDFEAFKIKTDNAPWRLVFRLKTQNPTESPMIEWLEIVP